MANYTAHKTVEVEFVWHLPEELITAIADRDFSAGQSNWNPVSGDDITWDNISMNFACDEWNAVRLPLSLNEGVLYKLEYRVTAYTSGSLVFYMGGGSGISIPTSVGHYVYYLVAGSSDFVQFGSANFIGSIDNVSINNGWWTAPFYYLIGYGRNYGRWYGNRGPDYSLVSGYGRNYGQNYGLSEHYLSPKGWASGANPIGVSHTDNLPISMPANNLTGYRAPTLTDVFYNRLMVEPLNINFEILVSTKTANILVWNGYLDQSVTLDDLLLSGFDGLQIIGDTPPTVFDPLQERTYVVRATMDGPPTISARLTFDWESGFVDSVVNISGIRIVLYPYLYRPDMIENLEWMTKILTSDDGSETRQGLRESPRQIFSVNSFISPNENARVDNLLYGWRHQSWAIPVWGEGRHPTSAVSALDITIDVDTRFGDFRANSLAIIWENDRKFDLFTIVSLTTSQITLDQGTIYSYGVGATVCPVRIGRMTRHPQRKSKGHNAILNVILAADDNTYFTVGASDIVYLSEDTYLDTPDMPGGKAFADNYQRDIRVIDYKTGAVTQYSTWDHTKISRYFLVVLEGLEEIWNFRLWLHRRGGKQRPFWMPTFENNMRVSGIGNMGDTFSIWEDANRVHGSDRNHIYVRMKNGTKYLRTVTDISDIGGGQSNVAVDTPITEDKENVDFISYMGLKRLDSDRIKLKWLANDVVECRVPIKEITP